MIGDKTNMSNFNKHVSEEMNENYCLDAETQKRIEDAFNIINDYTIDLYYLSIQNKIKHYVDFVACWECLDNLKCAYREIVEKTQ